MWYTIYGNSARSEILVHNEPGKHYAMEKWVRHKSSQIMWLNVYEISRISKSKETENILEVSRAWGEAVGLIEMDCVMRVGFPYKKTKMFWNEGEAMVVQHLWIY